MQPVARWLDARAQSRAIAIEFGDERTRYADLAGDVAGLAAWLHRELPAGARIAWLGHNAPEQLSLLLACARAGCALVPLNWRLTATELEFFEAICSVDGVGVKKALRAMVRPVRDVATAIEEQDVKDLATLPGIGAAMAERIVAKLRRKMAKFALLIAQDLPPDQAADHDVINEAYQALCMLGHSPADARQKLEAAVAANKKLKTIEDLLEAVYRQQRGE